MNKKEITEGLGELADGVERDHEVQMARAEVYKIAKQAVHLHKMLSNVSEEEGLEGWVQSKITKSADMIGSVYHHLDYEANAPDAMAEGKDEKERLSSLYKQLEKMKKSNDKDGVEHTQGLIVQAKKNLGMNEAQSPAQKAAFAKMLAKKSGKKPAEGKEKETDEGNAVAEDLRPAHAKELRNKELNKDKGPAKSGKTTGPDDYDFLKYKNKKEKTPKKMDVTDADKKMNTTAYKRMKAGDPRYNDKTTKTKVKEAKDTHCSDKCCGADVKREDCKCPPTCKHCNCNAVDEGKYKNDAQRKAVHASKAEKKKSYKESLGDRLEAATMREEQPDAMAAITKAIKDLKRIDPNGSVTNGDVKQAKALAKAGNPGAAVSLLIKSFDTERKQASAQDVYNDFHDTFNPPEVDDPFSYDNMRRDKIASEFS